VPPPPPPFDAALGDSPLLALLRQEWLSWHHRQLALALASCWPLPGDSKSLRVCRTEGLLPGVQGLHARFLLGMQRAQEVAVDALLPYAPGAVSKDTVKELVAWGVAAERATQIAEELVNAAATAAKGCATLRTYLHAAGADGAREVAVRGTLRLLPLTPALAERCATGGGPVMAMQSDLLLVVYEPEQGAAARWLKPVRDAAPLPPPGGAVPFGSLSVPLYAAASRPDVRAALAAADVPVTPFTAVLLISAAHYAKLSHMHRTTAAAGVPSSPATLLRRIFCLLARYETFTGNAAGLQGAVPHHVFDVLERTYGVEGECFASPLNAHFPSFCSAFPDTDAPFGSMGSFFPWRPLRGAFEANPPFVNDSMLAMSRHLGSLLEAAAAARTPLTFFVIVPSWTDAYYFKLLAASAYLRASRSLPRKEHEYIDGLQYRADRVTWGANVDSTIFLLATDAAVAGWPRAGGAEVPAAARGTGAIAGGGAGGGAGAGTGASGAVTGTGASGAAGTGAWEGVVAAFRQQAAAADPRGRCFRTFPIPAVDWPAVPQTWK